MGYCPGFLLKIGRFRTLGNSPQTLPNNPRSSWKSICKVHRRLFWEFRTIPGTYPNPPSLPRLFAQDRPISDPWGFTPNLHQQSRKQLEMHLQAHRRRLREFGTIPGIYSNPTSLKPWAIAKAFLLKIGWFRTLGNSPKIFTNNPESSWKSICKHIGGVSQYLPKSAMFRTSSQKSAALEIPKCLCFQLLNSDTYNWRVKKNKCSLQLCSGRVSLSKYSTGRICSRSILLKFIIAGNPIWFFFAHLSSATAKHDFFPNILVGLILTNILCYSLYSLRSWRSQSTQ